MIPNAKLVRHLQKFIVEQLEFVPQEEQEWIIAQFMNAIRWFPFEESVVAIDSLLFFIPEPPSALHHLPLYCKDRKKKMAYIKAATLFVDQDVAEYIRHIDETAENKVLHIEQAWEKIILYLKETTMPISFHTLDDIQDACCVYLRMHPAATPSKRADALCMACIEYVKAELEKQKPGNGEK